MPCPGPVPLLPAPPSSSPSSSSSSSSSSSPLSAPAPPGRCCCRCCCRCCRRCCRRCAATAAASAFPSFFWNRRDLGSMGEAASGQLKCGKRQILLGEADRRRSNAVRRSGISYTQGGGMEGAVPKNARAQGGPHTRQCTSRPCADRASLPSRNHVMCAWQLFGAPRVTLRLPRRTPPPCRRVRRGARASWRLLLLWGEARTRTRGGRCSWTVAVAHAWMQGRQGWMDGWKMRTWRMGSDGWLGWRMASGWAAIRHPRRETRTEGASVQG